MQPVRSLAAVPTFALRRETTTPAAGQFRRQKHGLNIWQSPSFVNDRFLSSAHFSRARRGRPEKAVFLIIPFPFGALRVSPAWPRI